MLSLDTAHSNGLLVLPAQSGKVGDSGERTNTSARYGGYSTIRLPRAREDAAECATRDAFRVTFDSRDHTRSCLIASGWLCRGDAAIRCPHRSRTCPLSSSFATTALTRFLIISDLTYLHRTRPYSRTWKILDRARTASRSAAGESNSARVSTRRVHV